MGVVALIYVIDIYIHHSVQTCLLHKTCKSSRERTPIQHRYWCPWHFGHQPFSDNNRCRLWQHSPWMRKLPSTLLHPPRKTQWRPTPGELRRIDLGWGALLDSEVYSGGNSVKYSNHQRSSINERTAYLNVKCSSLNSGRFWENAVSSTSMINASLHVWGSQVFGFIDLFHRYMLHQVDIYMSAILPSSLWDFHGCQPLHNKTNPFPSSDHGCGWTGEETSKYTGWSCPNILYSVHASKAIMHGCHLVIDQLML